MCPALPSSAGPSTLPLGRGTMAPSMLALPKDRAPLLGRSAEIEVLTGLLDDVEHRGAALVLRGDPGIGKSRLLAEALALAEKREMNVLATRGVQSEAR